MRPYKSPNTRCPDGARVCSTDAFRSWLRASVLTFPNKAFCEKAAIPWQ
jgi:hypothetical protein